MNTLLEAEHLTKVFAQRGKEPFKAVDDVSFSLQAGETLGIVGESGSGKSTLAKMITRLTDITDGTLKFQGKDITKLKQSQLRDVYGNIQMVFQNPAGSFDPRRTLGDGIGESLRNRGMKKADIAIRVKEAVFDLCKLFVQCFFVGGVCQSQFFLTVQVFFIHGPQNRVPLHDFFQYAIHFGFELRRQEFVSAFAWRFPQVFPQIL